MSHTRGFVRRHVGIADPEIVDENIVAAAYFDGAFVTKSDFISSRTRGYTETCFYLGKSDIGEIEYPIGPDMKVTCRFKAPKDGTVKEVIAYVKAIVDDTPMKTAVYADVAGLPGALLGYSEEVLIKNVAQFQGFPFTVEQQVDIVKGEYYHLTLFCSVDSKYYADPGKANQWVRNWDDYSNGFSNPFGDVEVFADLEITIYARL